MKYRVGLVVACQLTLISLSAAHAQKQPSQPPNVVLILADDQSYRDFGFMGNSIVHTPHIDALASKSATFTHGYVPMSVCRPSLATLLTGLYPHQHGIHFNHPPPGLRAMRKMTATEYETTRRGAEYLIRNTASLPRILARNGYACLQTGKHWEGSFRAAGFTHGMTLGKPSERVGPVTGTRAQENGELVAHGNGDAGLTIGRESMDPIFRFIEKHAKRRPFFVWYAPFLPHTPFDAPDRFRRLYDKKKVPPHLLPYYAEIARFDQSVGDLMTVLKKKRLLSETLIVFVSDNGFRPRKDGRERANNRSKLSQFEDGLRTPLLIRWDGHTRISRHDQLVHSIDIVPTVLSAVGLPTKITQRMKGRDLMRVASGRSTLPDRPVFGAIYPNDAQSLGQPSRHVRARWMRQGRFKLIQPGPAKPAIPLSLFDLKSDPQEATNLAALPQHAGRLQAMRKSLDAWWNGQDDSRVTPRANNSK